MSHDELKLLFKRSDYPPHDTSYALLALYFLSWIIDEKINITLVYTIGTSILCVSLTEVT